MSMTTLSSFRLPALACLVSATSFSAPLVMAGEKNPAISGSGVPYQQGTPLETDLDLPGDPGRYYGQRPDLYRDPARKIAKVDLDGDFNYDGVVDNDDPADGGAFEITPPGLVVGVGELTQVVLRVRPYRLDYDGQAVIALEVKGINRGDKSGLYPDANAEMSSMGHIKVWSDANRSQLLLDSRDPAMRLREWAINDRRFPPNTPGNVPRTVWVEGTGVSQLYSGDIRLLLSSYHRGDVAQPEPGQDPSQRKKSKVFKRFKASYDHILLTVAPDPHRKELVVPAPHASWKGR